MVDAEQVENRGIYVPNVDGVFDDIVTEVIGFAVDDTTLDTAACHPARKTFRMVVAPIIVRRKRALTVHSSSEFAAPND